MNIGAFAIFILGVMVAGAAPAMAQSGVVINEVDINPPGLDSQSISEWVELYNPTNSTVSIGGWQILPEDKLRKSMTIPFGTFISPGEYEIFSHGPLWFSDANEVVILYDGQRIVDKTHVITDADDDYTSWQRIYDGYDTDKAEDWKFVTSSAGSSNGMLQESGQDSTLKVTISTDKSEYTFGQRATITGSVSEKVARERPFFGIEAAKVEVTGPGYSNQFLLYPDQGLNYKTDLSLQKVLGITGGTYRVDVIYAGATAQTSFTVGEEAAETTIHQDVELAISAASESYTPGQTVVISGSTTEVREFEGVHMSITGPEGEAFATRVAYPDDGGDFSADIYISAVRPALGTYMVDARYTDKSASASFELVDELAQDSRVRLSTDKQAYGLDETVTISGGLNGLWVPSLDIEIIQINTVTDGSYIITPVKELDIVRLEGDSTFVYEFPIADNPDRYGEYRVKVSQDVGEAEVFFSVVENPDSHQTVQSAKLTVFTAKPQYLQDEQLTIRGKVAAIFDSSTFHTSVVEMELTKLGDASPRGDVQVGYTLTAVPDLGGNYEVSDTLYRHIYEPGTYRIDASYSAGLYTASGEFTVINPLDVDEQIILDIDREVVGLGEEVTINGIFTKRSQDTPIDITLYKPDGTAEKFTDVSSEPSFTWSWTTPAAEKERQSFGIGPKASNYGIYKVVFVTNAEVSEVFFRVSADPENDTLDVQPIEIATDKPVYNAGERITVYGTAQKLVQGQAGFTVEDSLQISVRPGTPPYKDIHRAVVYPDSGGKYASEFSLPVSVPDGTYRITAEYGDHRVHTLFAIGDGFTYEGGDLAISINTDRDTYSPGETVSISGKLNKLVYLEKIDIIVVREDQTRITCGAFTCGPAGESVTVVPTGAGTFSHKHTLGADAPGGKYTATADVEFGKFSTSFEVTGDAEPPAVKSEPQEAEAATPAPITRVIDKVNSIPDSRIPITVAATEQDGVQLLPKVLQGSLFTSARGEEASVNLMLTISDGTCIIGPENCLVSGATRSQGQIYETVSISGTDYKVRYSGSDVRLEKFSILPASGGSIDVEEWQVQVLKEEQPSRFYYRITRAA